MDAGSYFELRRLSMDEFEGNEIGEIRVRQVESNEPETDNEDEINEAELRRCECCGGYEYWKPLNQYKGTWRISSFGRVWDPYAPLDCQITKPNRNDYVFFQYRDEFREDKSIKFSTLMRIMFPEMEVE